MTKAEIENGDGRILGRHTIIYQFDFEDNFDTGDKGTIGRPGWHVAGYYTPGGKLHWVDLWTTEKEKPCDLNQENIEP
jgi:hypothetical protein